MRRLVGALQRAGHLPMAAVVLLACVSAWVLRDLTVDNGVQFLMAMPISRAEHAFVKEHGGEALEDRLEAAAIDPFDVHRRSVC